MGRRDRQGVGLRLTLLDTHVLLWFRAGAPRLGELAREAVESAWAADDVAASAISFWELGMLAEKGRIDLPGGAATWRRLNLRQGLSEIPVDGEIGARGAALADLPGDPTR